MDEHGLAERIREWTRRAPDDMAVAWPEVMAALTGLQRYQSLFESAPGACLVTDLKGVILEANQAASLLLGGVPEQLVGLALADLLVSDDRANGDELSRLTGEATPDEAVLRMRSLAGVSMEVAASVSRVTNASHAPASLLWLLRDVTVRRQAERGQWFLTSVSRDLAMSLDVETTLGQVARLAVPALADWCIVYLVANEGQVHRLAVAHHDPALAEEARLSVQREVAALMPGDPVAQALRSGESLLVSDLTPEILVASARHADHLALLNRLGLCSQLVAPLLAHGRVLGAISLMMAESGRRYQASDVPLTEEVARRAAVALENARLYDAERRARQAAEEAADRTARLQALAVALSEALTPREVAAAIVEQGLAACGADAGSIYALEDDGRVFRLLDYAGYPMEAEATHARFPADLPGPLGDAVRERDLVIIESPEDLIARWPALARAQAASGDAAVVAAPLLVERRTLGVLYIVSRRPRRFSAAERGFLTVLARQCAQALERARLYEVSQEALKARDQFLSIAAHELKTPVTSIKGNAQFLRLAQERGRLDERRLDQALRVIDERGTYLAQLINDLLDVSRLRLDRLPLDARPLELGSFARLIVARFQEQQERPIDLRLPDAPCIVLGDSGRLEQVLANILENSVKFSPAGGAIDVSLERETGGVLMRVRDEGIGLPIGAAEMIFQPFGRASNAERRQVPGLGLGLHISREIVERHGGRLWAESQGEDTGTTICLWLPAAKPA